MIIYEKKIKIFSCWIFLSCVVETSPALKNSWCVPDIQSTKEVDTHYGIQTVIFTEVLHEILSLIFALIRNAYV